MIKTVKFGRGAETFVCVCGRFYYTITGCLHCQDSRMRVVMARKVEHKKLNGIPIKAYQKRGRKAYISRMANLAFTDPERFKRLFDKLEKNDERKAKQVKRKIKQRSKNDI